MLVSLKCESDTSQSPAEFRRSIFRRSSTERALKSGPYLGQLEISLRCMMKTTCSIQPPRPKKRTKLVWITSSRMTCTTSLRSTDPNVIRSTTNTGQAATPTLRCTGECIGIDRPLPSRQATRATAEVGSPTRSWHAASRFERRPGCNPSRTSFDFRNQKRTNLNKMLGNAVPPLMAKHIASILLNR